MNLFLDDERMPKDVYWKKLPKITHIVRNFDEFKKTVETIPNFISFDHDLGNGNNGFDCCKYLISRLIELDYAPFPEYEVHSQNPVGTKNIHCLIQSYERLRKYSSENKL